MENTSNKLSIAEIVSNCDLRGSIYSTMKCSVCGKKLVASTAGNELFLTCEGYNQPESHDSIRLNLTEIAAIINFNPIV